MDMWIEEKRSMIRDFLSGLHPHKQFALTTMDAIHAVLEGRGDIRLKVEAVLLDAVRRYREKPKEVLPPPNDYMFAREDWR